MPSNIWTRCGGRSNLRRLAGRAWRVVESQHLFSTRKLVDSDEEQRLLEQLIEDVKPPSGAPPGLHWLLSTPFRYPPLRHGSRFGTRAERGIWYGSRTRATAFAEKAYYLLLFLAGTSADLTPLETDVSIFQAAYETDARGGPHPRPLRAPPAGDLLAVGLRGLAGPRPRHARGRSGSLPVRLGPRSGGRPQRRAVRSRRAVFAPAQRARDLALRRHAPRASRWPRRTCSARRRWPIRAKTFEVDGRLPAPAL